MRDSYLTTMIDNLRASIRLVLFFLVSLLTVLSAAAGNFVVGWLKPSLAVRWKNISIGMWARITAGLIGLSITKKGTPPEPPFFLVSNHLSYIDVIPLWYYLEATFVAKSDVKSWPFFGWGTQILGVLFIDRESMRDTHRTNKQIRKTISGQQGVILFPEGTSTKGDRVLPFNAPLLQYPAQSQMPVHAAALTYRSEHERWPAHRSICWWGDMTFFGHFWDLLKMPGFEVEITFSEQTVVENDRKKLADRLHKVVAGNFDPVIERQQPEQRTQAT